MTLSSRHFAATCAVSFSLLAVSSAWAADKLAATDASMLKDIAQANMAEVETGKLALAKSSNPEIKQFAQMMVDDHTKGLADVKTLASSKGTELPDGPDVKHKAAALEFKALSGDMFNSRYVKQAGVGDHEATEALLKKTQADAKDADLKALASKMLPIVQGHLQHARQLVATAEKK
jgi:putative membrane protein